MVHPTMTTARTATTETRQPVGGGAQQPLAAAVVVAFFVRTRVPSTATREAHQTGPARESSHERDRAPSSSVVE